jgi:hypothetical protein
MQSFPDKLCKKFSFGRCPAIGCNYYHIQCTYNFSCIKKDCNYGHPLLIKNRILMNEMYNIFRIKDKEHKRGAEFCTYNMTCINPECSSLHPFGLESRIEINKMYIKLKNQEKYDTYKITDGDDIKNEDVRIITSSVKDSEIYTKNFEVSKKTENIWNKPINANIEILEKKEDEDEDFQTVVKKTTKKMKEQLSEDSNVSKKSFKSENSDILCKYNICCTNNICNFYHPIPIQGRKNINKLYLEYREIDPEYKKGKSFCDKNILCENEDCENIHSFGIENRLKIICEYMSFIDKETPVKIEVKTQLSTTKNIDLSINSLEDFPSIKKTQSSTKIEETQSPVKIEDTKSPVKIEETKSPVKIEETQSPVKIEETQSPVKIEETQSLVNIKKEEPKNEFVDNIQNEFIEYDKKKITEVVLSFKDKLLSKKTESSVKK